MKYEEAMAFLEETKSYGSRLGLANIINLMAALGDVQKNVPVVHIGGTNGKGSTGAFLSAVLVEAGYLVGRFQTPDVFSYEEEFLLNGMPIEKERLARLFAKVQNACRQLTAQGLPHPTRFEVETAAAFLWFYEENVDIALVEVGMGGATDATNVTQAPLLSLFTSIGRDHMQFLGNTLEEIAAVKSGIIKEGCPVVSSPQSPAVAAVLKEQCIRRNAPLLWSEKDAVKGRKLGLLGPHQEENAACALAALQLLKERYDNITEEAICKGLAATRWRGRFEQISQKPAFFLDGAHNADAARRLKETLQMYFPGRRIVYIFGVLADKEYEEMAAVLFSPGDVVYTVTPPSPRALPAAALAEVIKKYNVRALPCETVHDAVEYALKETAEEDILLACGSLSYLKLIKK